MADRRDPPAWRRALTWAWPLTLLVAAWLWTPVRARSLYPGMSCTAGALSFLERVIYTGLFIPTGLVLLLLTVIAGRALRRGRRGGAAVLGAAAAGTAALYLVFGGQLAEPHDERAVACQPGGRAVEPLHCWTSSARPLVYEMNAYGLPPTDVASLEALAGELQSHKQDAYLFEAFVLDTRDADVADYSNGRIFTLQRGDLSQFGNVCLSERRAHLQAAVQHRIGFYRYSAQQSPPVDAFFLQHIASGGELQFEVLDLLHGLRLPLVAPADLRPEELAYLDRAAAAFQALNDDLDREQLSSPPPGALARMRTDFERLTTDLAQGVPPRLTAYRDSRLKRFLQNYELILVAEENAGQGQGAAQIHTSAYQEHRVFYFQEPRVTRLIGYLYLQEPGKSFSDQELSAVNWAVF